MKETNQSRLLTAEITRRKLVQTTVVGGLSMATGAFSLPFSRTAHAVQSAINPANDGKVIWSACTVNCGSRCPLRMHVVDGEIKYVETDNTGDDNFEGLHQVRACLRGRSMRRRVYNPDRLKYPMKRVGARGEGKFKRISWDEAFDTLAASMKSIINEYGNEAIYLNYGTGTLGGTMTRSWPPGSTLLARLMNCCGGYLNHYGDYSTAQIAAGLNYTYGGWADGNSPSDIENSKLVVLFGNNPGETRMSGGGVTYYLEQAREKSNAKMIVIDPRYTDTAAGREDEWIPLRPGTDAALACALAYVMISENLVDQPFLDKYCVGYDEKTLPEGAPKNSHYKAYILGQGTDKTAKTPQWAEAITGIPAAKIIKLGREIGSVKPAYIAQGWGPQRHANGENTSRAIAMLAILTGNVGINGGNSGAREGSYGLPFVRMPTLENPIKTSISMFLWTDAIERGPEMTATRDGVRGKDKLDVPIKFIWNYASNCLINQHAEINRTHDILQDDKKCEMIVVIDNHMTSSAQYADIILPDCTASEQMDFCLDASSGNMAYVIFADQVIKPRFECKNIYEMTSELAKRMGVEQQFTEGRTQEGWLRHLYQQSQKAIPELPSFEEFRKQGIFKKRDPAGHHVAYKAFRADPVANPLTTPSGKIEIYSAELAQIAATWELQPDDVIDPLPVYAAGFESFDDPLNQKYPLQLTGFHYKARTHSTYGNVEVLKAACRQEMWINPLDARERDIKNGDIVRIFNGRGEVQINAKVTPRMMPGVVALGEGAWYSPDENRIDRAGSINVLTTQRPSPLAKGNPSHTNLVQVTKA
ncbi:dimethylsulfoxide reductase subunit A [Yersinia enterocolitica]|uniref:dimethylsulfoxide reductase subunit A n=1 Tax=Yersinia enterocolitica TaxID=630 RepID=UPI002855A01F|nr:dimethylsulfoxide reductase subunit A [Yersinia enterocolitica]EKN4142262.1 dimethylsulfoxide reductase subunit A [Yersinia enterocolitica]HDL6727843.1 dimethylsulfoxide reductase subunit A [Yersinia enterocolitica]HDL7331002.1 dimethylsulfoxide reductase subunit A [Yersinia enterocolitica]HDM8347130.1 dimethylsulfoxide reductase subunit A [Yersinia enterocolitica]